MKFFGKTSRVWLVAIGGLLVGVLLILAIRFFTYDANYIHYHANFAVYLNGQKEVFKGPTYYEEVTACRQGSMMTPEGRAHMHDNVNNVVHVHDHAVTWGQFFVNLGWVVGDDFIQTRDNLYQNSGQNVLHIILNGQDLTGIGSITNKVIGNEDRLLLSFGDVSQDNLQKKYLMVANTAHEHNQKKDPTSCSGPSSTTISDRFHHLF